MKNEKQKCNLKNAIKLKELGVKQDSLFGWYDAQVEKVLKSKEYVSRRLFETGQVEYILIADAFSVAELGEKLPEDFCSVRTVFKDKAKKWLCATPACYFNLSFENHQYAETEADARAEVVIADLENKDD